MNTLIIMMGGKSSRMGEEKCLLEVGGRPIIERVLASAEPFFDEIILSTNEPDKYSAYGLPMVADEVPDCGPVGGLLSVMNAYPRDYYQTLPCDAPFASGEVALRTLEIARGADVGLVRTPDGHQPLFSAYSFSARDAFAAAIQNARYRIRACIDGLDIRIIPHEQLGVAHRWQKLFFNVNFPEDLPRAAALVLENE